MTPAITVLLLNYQRPRNIPLVIESIRQQTVRAVVFLWNNGVDDVNQPGIDRYESSDTNLGCMIRWKMARAADTEYLMCLDDDLCFAREDALEDILASLREVDHPRRVIGVTGCRFGAEPVYTTRRDFGVRLDVIGRAREPAPTDGDVPVDMLKGRMMALRRDALDGLAFPDEREDDIFLCGTLARGERSFHRIPRRLHYAFRELPEGGVGNWMKPEHFPSRDRAAARYFRAV